MIRDMRRIDPDTGGFGWDGRIVSVSYDHEQEAATVALDTETSRFEALASRFAMFSGQG